MTHGNSRPSGFERFANKLVGRLVALGVGPRSMRSLSVRGRSSGKWYSSPVNLLELNGTRYLLAPRGTTQWVRNLRAAGSGELRRGKFVETFQAVELPDEAKPVIMQSYLQRWHSQVKQFFPGLDASSSLDELLARAGDYPVFELS
ncbi:deazaflavin-dependent oxidoreductase, nitroreductase family [Lentzea waywayandensis]|uniref:Deazaflavin-dependent oxidoreductase, nitroreductase family n=1 Tax=Lentzea waywayandensis TaxID=84724 RepID=A0A1I6ER18_9PSEU|nr:nitroreductase/quinone reductase family protein [Lentzea waywayandensis]SFR20115.1 deazaflavin-dependent oxidoreductase, nitroreductase family [Lentzea waywayandensis]